MKKIILIAIVSFGSFCLMVQTANAQSSQGSKVMSVEEANRLNGTVQPTYQGGKPYTQWVAEEKAKQNNAASTPVNLYAGTSIKVSNITSSKTNAPAADAGQNVPAGSQNGSAVTIVEKPEGLTKPASRTAEEIEKAKQQEEQNKVQPVKTDASKTETAPLPSGMKLTPVSAASEKPAAEKKQNN